MKSKRSKSKRKRFYVVCVCPRRNHRAIYRVDFKDGKVILTKLHGWNLDSVRLKHPRDHADHVIVGNHNKLSTYKKGPTFDHYNHDISSVVGLFLTRSEAEKAFLERVIYSNDAIFSEQTEAVKKAFADNEHCVFE